ncbi:efflux RND transporter periplasmic adaptor subunit [Maribius pontilimi]|uniref:Efflux RND transporter periplasmic adaptor subunit n=1 Tax=Palleronia pontilimi TaxID=1964209 RepID=A0A934IFM6_9RHOB|nr:efflux RND transporter periplasmic adaptor subunit [Palleronia pontilimi]MBJ3761998.1 efflux RND transporter periplasmic adaptor subunit [Palleronia pontilimi]
MPRFSLRACALTFCMTLGVPVGPAMADAFDCVITPALTVGIGSPVSGLLEDVLVAEGDFVAKGQVIARLRSEVERKTVELLKVQADSDAEIEAQDSRLVLAQKRLERARDLMARKVGTQEQLEAAEAETEVIARERIIAEMRKKVAALELQRASAQLDQRVIRSPIDGIVVTRHLYSGEYLAAEDRVFTISQIDPLHVEAFLPVSVFRAVSPGAVLEVRPDAPVDGVMNAEVELVDRIFDAASATFGIRLRLPNPDGAIPAGHRCQVELPIVGQ